jgi:hypothetical protein
MSKPQKNEEQLAALELPRGKVWRDGNVEYRLVLDASGFEGILIVQRKLRTADGHKWQYDGSRTTFELLCIGAMLWSGWNTSPLAGGAYTGIIENIQWEDDGK